MSARPATPPTGRHHAEVAGRPGRRHHTPPLLLGACIGSILLMWLDFDALRRMNGPLFPSLDARFRLWLLIYGVQATIWVASLRLTWGPVRELWTEQHPADKWAASLTVLGAAIPALLIVLARPDDVAKAMEYSTIPQQSEKLWMLMVGLLAGVVPAFGIALHRANASLVGANPRPAGPIARAPSGAVRVARPVEMGRIDHRGRNAGLRHLPAALLGRAADVRGLFPVEEVIGYGLAFSLLLATVYLPTAAALTSQAQLLRDDILAADKVRSTTPATWPKARKELEEGLSTGVDIQKVLTTGVGILGPLIGALLSQALPAP